MKLIILLCVALEIFGAAPQRIISTAPSITETLFAMGLGPRIVGVTVYCKYPPEALKLPKIGDYLRPDMEAIVRLHPDLVVVQAQPNHLSEELSRLHITFVEVQSHNLDEIYAGARSIGKAANAAQGAEKMIGDMQMRLQAIRTLVHGRPKPSAVFLVGHNPGSLEGLIAGSGSSYFSDLLNTAGGTNIFSDTATPYPKVSLEEILARNPDFILELSGESRPSQQQVTALWRNQPALKAVTAHRVYAIPSVAFLVPGPRAVEAASELLHLLHPEIAQ